MDYQKENVFSHYFASKGQLEVCVNMPYFACFQPPQNVRHQNNLDGEKQAIDVLGC